MGHTIRYYPLSGWWFGTYFIFPYIGKFIIPIDELIFFREVETQPPTSSDFSIFFCGFCWATWISNPNPKDPKDPNGPRRLWCPALFSAGLIMAATAELDDDPLK